MGMNIAPHAMSREEFEARKAGLNLRRKHENERRVERYMKHYNTSLLFCEGDVFVALCVTVLGLWGKAITVLSVEGMFGLLLGTMYLWALVAKPFCVTIN